MTLSGVDDQNLMLYALTTRDLYRHSARDILMSWIMDLPAGMDTAKAAKTILETYSDHPDLIEEEMQNQLLELLQDVVNAQHNPRGRRGGQRRGQEKRARIQRQQAGDTPSD